MKNLVIVILASLLVAPPATAQEEDGSTLMERGAQQFLEGLLQEMEPSLKGLRDFMDQMGPAMVELFEEVKDWSAYEPPEVLENGDIIIRRKPKSDEREEERPELDPAEPVPQIEL